MCHAKALSVIPDYDMYLECAKGNLEEEQKVKKLTIFWVFHKKLFKQMLICNTSHHLYPGDESMHMLVVHN